jgi:hypothetical protein
MELADVLAPVMPVEVEDDGAITIRHDGTFASLRTVEIAEGLELVSLNQLLAWDLPCNDNLRKCVAALAQVTALGTVTMIERAGGAADVMLRYNFPAGGLDAAALQTLVGVVLAGGSEARRALLRDGA